ncbi:uncharacterized protein [Primulina huaijiensis]|uniref:uncharacterized protein isoform X2 n=1 Tax=Primulina huaijiensis TaxID=1492673 RepID=UPI003CC6EB1B
MDGVSKNRHNDLQECQNIQGMLYNQMDTVSKQQHNDVQGMTLKNKNVGKTHFQLQDETNTQPLILIDNHTTRNSKERDCQNIQGASRNQIDQASNKKDIGLQGLTSTTTFNNTPHVENDFMDEEFEQDVDSESESLDAEKKTRGPTFMKEIWGRPSTLPRIKIRCDDMGRPIGSRKINLLIFWVLWQERVNFVRLTWKIGIKCPKIVRKNARCHKGKARPSSWNRKLDATFNSKKIEKLEVRTKKEAL